MFTVKQVYNFGLPKKTYTQILLLAFFMSIYTKLSMLPRRYDNVWLCQEIFTGNFDESGFLLYTTTYRVRVKFSVKVEERDWKYVYIYIRAKFKTKRMCVCAKRSLLFFDHFYIFCACTISTLKTITFLIHCWQPIFYQNIGFARFLSNFHKYYFAVAWLY